MGENEARFFEKGGGRCGGRSRHRPDGKRRLYAKDEDKVYKWKMATPWATGMPLYTNMAKILPDVVKKLSNNRLIIDVFPAGAIRQLWR